MSLFDTVRQHLDNSQIEDLKRTVNQSDALDVVRLLIQLPPDKGYIFKARPVGLSRAFSSMKN